MASKKGIAVTAIILAAITGASFLLWAVPQNREATFVVTDYENYLDGVKSIHEILEESIEIEYNDLQAGKISPQDYIEITEETSTQVVTQISQFITTKPPEEWEASYINYMEALKSFNSYIVETKVLASMIENESTKEEMDDTLNKIEMLKAQYIESGRISDQTRPG